ncbi:sensor histidine kinase [Nocardioides sp. MAHUQ-72]|uniref:sensor histidine kinase n=1 Tax=unclassified Nocardioides TaxID=2615069 RepID=UPI00361E3174
MTRITTKLSQVPWGLPASGGWTWRSSALLTAVLLQPYLLVLAMEGSATLRLRTASVMSLLLMQLAILASAVVLQYDWRISRRTATGWMAMALSYVAAQHLPFALLAVAGSDVGHYGYVVGVTQLPSALVLLTLAVLAARGAPLPAWNPLVVGLLLGGLAATARLVLVDTGADPTLTLSAPATAAIVSVGVVLTVAVAAVLARTETLPGWVRTRVVAGLLCLLASRVVATGQEHGSPSPLAVAWALFGTVLLCGAAAAMLRQTIGDNSRRLVSLAHRAATAEVSVRHGQEKLHELHATVAGVAMASRLLIQNGGPTGSQRQRLESLLDSEMTRLERMLTKRGQQPVEDICLDELLLPLVETQQTLGVDVVLRPSAQQVLGRPDDLAEVIHILLSNAARHAPESHVEVTSARRGGAVEISVSDDGPGVPETLRASLFAWGARSASSPGQGIGLQLAKRLMLEQGGNLRLENEGRLGGATFVLTIPTSSPGMP